MSGEVRPPAVFLANSLIAQRHFNARLFAAFLRQRVVAEGALPKPGEQKIALANVLPNVLPDFPFRDWLPKNLASRPLDFASGSGRQRPGFLWAPRSAISSRRLEAPRPESSTVAKTTRRRSRPSKARSRL